MNNNQAVRVGSYWCRYDSLYFSVRLYNFPGKIYLQDGFGKDYTTCLNRTLSVYNTDDLLVEMNGNPITATVSFRVKPAMNFDSPDQANAAVCAYIDQSRLVIDYPTETPMPTWTPE